MTRCSRILIYIANTIHFGLIDNAGESYEAPVHELSVARKTYRIGEGCSIADWATKNVAEEEGPERKFISFPAVRTRGLPRSVNLRSGQRDYRIYSGGRSIRPYRPLTPLFGPAVKNNVLCG
jgi:hypothetical protein